MLQSGFESTIFQLQVKRLYPLQQPAMPITKQIDIKFPYSVLVIEDKF